MENCIELKNKKAYFNKNETLTLPARAVTVAYVRILNDLKVGYLEQIPLEDEIYARKGLVNNNDGKAYIPFYNTLEKEVTIEVPILEIFELEELPLNKPP